MEFLQEIKDNVLNDLEFDNLTYKIYILGKSGIAIFGAREVVSFSCNEIVLKTKNERFVFSGENLSIKSLSQGDVFLSGVIQKMEITK